MKHTDFQLPTQCGFHYDPVRRQVRAYQPDAVYVLRLDPPQAWLRDARLRARAAPAGVSSTLWKAIRKLPGSDELATHAHPAAGAGI